MTRYQVGWQKLAESTKRKKTYTNLTSIQKSHAHPNIKKKPYAVYKRFHENRQKSTRVAGFKAY